MPPGQSFVKVAPETLRAKAAVLKEPSPTVPQSPIPPCILVLAGQGLKQIVSSRDRLASVIEAGDTEAERLAGCLEAAATAYDTVDEAMSNEIAGGTPGGAGSVMPPAPQLPPSKTPIITSCQDAPEDDGCDWTSAVAQIEALDQGVSLQDFASGLHKLSDDLTARAKLFSLGNTHWEGKAAEAAEGALRRHESWLFDMASAARRLAGQAQDFDEVHSAAKARHPTQADVSEVNRMLAEWTGPWAMSALQAYADKQRESEEVRDSYANKITFPPMSADAPPSGAFEMSPVTPGDVAGRPAGQQPQFGSSNGTGGGGQAGAGGQPSGAPAGAPMSPASMDPAAPQPPQSQQSRPASGGPASGGSPSGAGSGGGAPTGGGMPGTGAGGLPTGGKPDPSKVPDGPSVKPAASGAGGGGAGAGGGGGGSPARPLGPAVGADSVAPSPAGAGPGNATSGAGRAGTGGMMGGMGGMPMGAGAGQNQSGGKKRDGKVAPDEELYTEDRPWTDGVIGNQRRRSVQEDKEST